MSITSYSTLKSAVSDYLVYDDVESKFDTFLSLAEARMNRELRIREMQDVEDRVAGSSVLNGVGFSLNTSFIELMSISEENQGNLGYISPKMYWGNVSKSPATGQPTDYTIIGETVYLFPKTDSTRTYSVSYYRKINPLTSINATNNILDMAPDLYLYGVLSEAQPYLGDTDRAAEYSSLFKRTINDMNMLDARSRYRPGARMRTSVTTDGAFRIA